MLGETKKSASIRKSAKLPKLSIQEQIDNQQVADRMNRKIAFTKNPRHLLHTMSYAEAFATTQSFQGKFRVEPQELSFTEYDVSHVYQSELRLINNSKVIQRIKITPLKNKQFLLANIKYPREDSGDIAPGMAVVITIRFRPNSLNDYEDQLVVIAGNAVVKVPIIARRERCNISWPKKIECGHCWVGDTIKKEVVLKNKGGEATYSMLDCDQNIQVIKKGFFRISPAKIKFGKNTEQKITVEFSPETKGVFKQTVKYKTYEGDQQEIEISMEGGAYSAQIVLQSINSQKILERRMNNILFIQNTELRKQSSASLKISNLAVVQVDYFWHYTDDNIVIDKKNGKMKPSQLIQFNIKLTPKLKIPQTIKLQLYLHNLPEKSLEGGTCTKNINGIQAIPCLSIEVKTKPILSLLEVYPLHRNIIQPLYQNSPVKEWIGLVNNSTVKRTFKIQKIFEDKDLQTKCEVYEGEIQAKSQKKVQLLFNLTKLSPLNKRAYFLVQFDNSQSQIFSIQGKSTYPELIYSEDILYYGLCKTFTLNKRQLKIKNIQKTPVQFTIINENRFYELEFYDFYQFQDQNSFKRRFNIYHPATGLEVTKPFTVPPQTEIVFDCYLNTMGKESIQLEVFFQVKNGVKSKLKIVSEVQDVEMSMNRSSINMRQIYKGNVYNSNKFLSRQLQIINEGNHDCAYEIMKPDFDACELKIQPLKGIIKKNSYQRIDLILEPIKTGEFDINILWKFFDDFKMNPDLYLDQQQKTRYNQQDERKTLVKQKTLQLTGVIKGMAVNYYLKDETKAKKIKVKIDDIPQSVKMSNSSFHPSSIRSAKSLHENQKLVYPILEELNFFNCEINQVKQIQIIIENDSGLTTQYQIFAEQFNTLQKDFSAQKKTTKGLVKVEQQPFSSEMGQTFIKRRALDRSQKVHLGNNKGISILCEPASGLLHKKQTQKILITMFNDTSGRFKDFLVIAVKNHQTKKVPINIHIKGTPVALSKNQLGIDFNQQVPFMNLGMILHSNGLIKKNIKIVNNGPKQVELKWFIYPHNKVDKQTDIFNIQLEDPPQGSEDLVQIKWNALKPEIDGASYFDIEPKQRIIRGREEINFSVLIQEIKSVGLFSNLLVCQPYLLGGDKKIEMECLAVVLQAETIEALLSTDIENKNNINKFQKLAIPHEQEQTDSKNNIRVLKFKNNLSANLTFDLQLFNKDEKFESFKLVATKTNSPATLFSSTKKQIQTSFVLTSDSILQVTIELMGNPTNFNQWPLQARVRKEGQLIFSYSNKQQQKIDLIGWLLRPWVQIQMPNFGLFSPQNFEIDFGTVHVKNAKIHSIYLFNPTKSDGKYSISYIKYHQSIKYKFQQSLWTNLDYQDQKIQDEKKCWKLSQDSGLVKNNTIPIHYMPASLALPDQDDKYAQTHKPIQIQIQFKPEANLLYKSKFRVTVKQGPTYDIVMKGRGTYEEELQIK